MAIKAVKKLCFSMELEKLTHSEKSVKNQPTYVLLTIFEYLNF